MAVLLQSLCLRAKELYKMKLIAGEEHIENIVKWVHNVEDIEVGTFLTGYEIVFTTGIGNILGKETLKKFVDTLVSYNASALVLNIGPYIKDVPEEIITYCNEVQLPLFTIPWETKIVEITRDFCKQIFDSESRETSLKNDVMSYIFYPSNRESILPKLEKQGFLHNAEYCVIALGLAQNGNDISENDLLELSYKVSKEAGKKSNKYTLFNYESCLILILADSKDSTIKDIVYCLQLLSNDKRRLLIAVSNNKADITALPLNFKRVLSIYEMCKNTNMTPLFYNKLGVYKILLSLPNKELLFEYMQEVVGSLKKYDIDNGTDYYEFTKIYLANGAHTQKTADCYYIHRNTVSYKIAKIKKISGLDLLDLDTLLQIKLCCLIENMI